MVTVEVAGAVVDVVAVVELVDVVAVVVAGALEEEIGKSTFWWKFYEKTKLFFLLIVSALVAVAQEQTRERLLIKFIIENL